MNMMQHASILSQASKLGFRLIFADKILLLAGFLVYAVIMVLYGGVIKMIPTEDIAPFGLTNAQMIWYLGTTELVLFSCSSWNFKGLQQEFLSESIYLSLVRPYSTSLLRVAMWMGESVARLCVYFPLYLVFMTLLSGVFIFNISHVLGVMLCMPIGIFLMQSAFYIIGASCLWISQAEPAFWIWQKSIFLLGGMIWPLTLYPIWLETAVWVTPFPAMLALSGQWALDSSVSFIVAACLHQIIWGGVFLVLIKWFDGAVLRKIQSGEGV